MASTALIIWPLITILFFAALGPARGLIWSVLIGYLFLPESFRAINLPVVNYDKHLAISFSVLLAATLFRKKLDPDIRVGNSGLRNLLILLALVTVVIAPIGTYWTNQEVLVNGPRVRPALSINDLLGDMADQLIFIMPLLLAARLLTRPEHHRELLVAMIIMGFAYTFLVLFERRMSPQLNLWVYGYFPHAWGQHTRGGGFRPLVFLRHGLWLGFFLFTVFIAVLALTRDKTIKERALLPFLALWMLLVIFLSRNLGPLMLAIVLGPVILLLPFKFHARLAAAMGIMILFYPTIHDLLDVPMGKFLNFVGSISADRLQSFETRLINETELLARAMEKPIFGWGGWARMRIINENGIDTSLVDGAWIVFMGRYGWVGYLSFFGLLLAPIVFAMRSAARKPLTPVVSGFMIMMAGNFVYIIPNSTINPIAMLMLGALAAFARYDVVTNEANQEQGQMASPAPASQYTRFSYDDRPHETTRSAAAVPHRFARQGSSPHRRAVSTPKSSRSRRTSDS